MPAETQYSEKVRRAEAVAECERSFYESAGVPTLPSQLGEGLAKLTSLGATAVQLPLLFG